MSEGKENHTKIELGLLPGAAEAVKELAKPVYEDGLQPAVIQVGKSLETATKLVNSLLMPLRIGIYGFDTIETILKDGVAKRLAKWETKEEDAKTPPAYVVVPAIEALRYTASVTELREMFLNLIASSMASSRADSVHPSFVEILKQISPDEGRILALFLEQKALQHWSIEVKRHVMPPGQAGRFITERTFVRLSLIAKDAKCELPSMVPAYIDNLIRLGLVYEPRPWASPVYSIEKLRDPVLEPIFKEFYYRGPRFEELVNQHPELEEIVSTFPPIGNTGDHLEIWTGEIRLTEFGKALCRTCVAAEDVRGFLLEGAQNETLVNNRVRV